MSGRLENMQAYGVEYGPRQEEDIGSLKIWLRRQFMPTLITKRGKKRWKAVVMVDGLRQEKLFPDSTRKSKMDAIFWEQATKDAIKAPVINTEYLPLETWAEQYLDFSSSRFASKTVHEKIAAFKILAKHPAIQPSTNVSSITPGIIHDALKTQMENVSGHAANKVRKNLAAAWSWGQRYIDDFPQMANPFIRVDRFPEIEKPRYVPPEEDFWRLLEYVQAQPGLAAEQDVVILTTFLHCAGRRGEIWRLKFSDLDFQNKRLRLWTRKRKHGNYQSDWLPMTNELYESLKKWTAKRREMKTSDKEHVFVCLETAFFCVDHYGRPFTERRNYMTKICKKAGVTPFGFHAIRHLTASILYARGHKLGTIQSILRHENKSTTEIYLRSLGIDDVRVDLESALRKPCKVIDLKEMKKAV